MVFEHIEKLKRDFTDKYVVVDGERPELRRFKSLTGVVRTVNMNGRALVEFDGAKNIGWYDIDPDFLKVVDKPEPKAEAESEAPKKAAPKAKAAPKKEAAKSEPKKAAAGGGMSVADILAAARGGDSGETKTPAKTEAAPKPAEKKPAASGGGMSVADILAAARGDAGDAGGGDAGSTATPEPEAAPEPQVEEKEKIVVEDEAPAADSVPAGDIPTDVPGILAYCRKVDDK